MISATRETTLRFLVVDRVPEARRALHSVVDVDTQVLTLSPQFLAALRKLAPTRRRNRLARALGAALLLVAVLFAADGGMRGFLLDRGHHALALLSPRKALPVVPAGPVPALESPVAVPAVGETAAPLQLPPVEIASVNPSTAPAAKAPAKKAGSKLQATKRPGGHGGRG
jgi:hypothetical protein